MPFPHYCTKCKRATGTVKWRYSRGDATSSVPGTGVSLFPRLSHAAPRCALLALYTAFRVTRGSTTRGSQCERMSVIPRARARVLGLAPFEDRSRCLCHLKKKRGGRKGEGMCGGRGDGLYSWRMTTIKIEMIDVKRIAAELVRITSAERQSQIVQISPIEPGCS